MDKLLVLKKLLLSLLALLTLQTPHLGAEKITQQIGGVVITFDSTDENSNETLIINASSHAFSSLGNVSVLFSVTNASAQDQNVQLSIPKVDSPERKVLSIKRFVGNNMTVIPEKVWTSATSSTKVITPASTSTQAVWDSLSLNTYSPFTVSERKDKKGLSAKEQGQTLIHAGETAFFKAELSFGSLKVQNEEFFIEAFGDNGAYGILDPTFTTYEDFNSYSDGNLDTQGCWTHENTGGAFTVQGVTVQEGTKAATNVGTSGHIDCTFTSQTATILYGYIRKTVAAVGVKYIEYGQGSAIKVYIKFDSDGNIKYFDGGLASYVSLGACADTTWCQVGVEIDTTNQANKFRANLDGGTFSGWVDAAASFTAIDLLYIESETGGTGFWDFFQYTSEAAAGGGVVTRYISFD